MLYHAALFVGVLLGLASAAPLSISGCQTDIPQLPSLAFHQTLRGKVANALLDQNGNSKGVAFIEGASVRLRHTSDTEEDFVQEANFRYVSGVEEPDFAIAFTISPPVSYLFAPKRDAYYALWNGKVMTKEEIKEKYQVDVVEYDEDMVKVLQQLAAANNNIVYVLDNQANTLPADLFDVDTQMLSKAITVAREIKTAEEITLLRIASKVSSDAHAALIADVRAGLYEFNMDAYFRYYTGSCGLRVQSYTPIVGAGEHGAILHYNDNNALMKDGDLLLIDAGASFQGYTSDITRTYPVDGRFTAVQAEIYKYVLDIQTEFIRDVKPGNNYRTLQTRAINRVCEYLLDGGYLQGNLNSMILAGVCRIFMPHGIGHYVGLDVHDAGGAPNIFREGEVFTVEPGIYFNRAFYEQAKANSRQRPFLVESKIEALIDAEFGGVRIEDVMLVTATGYEYLSDAPHSIEQVLSYVNASSLRANRQYK